MKAVTLDIMIALLLCGCAAESRTTGTAKLSRALVERSILDGKTTKAQVRALLGEPQSTVSGSYLGLGAVESWSYSKTFYRDPTEKGFGYGVAYNMASGSQYDRVEVSILTISFDANGIVKSHVFANSASGAQ
jgi:outer membrane protein assembly factor BamE (lipoprotein component of BamABCDE complex)